jgi:hypothetical protein
MADFTFKALSKKQEVESVGERGREILPRL